MPRQRTTYHHGNLPRALVAAAVELLGERGPERFSLREAAARVGVDPAACYRHFRDKGAVLAAVAQQGFERLALAMEQATARVTDPHAVLLKLGRCYVDFALSQPAYFHAMFGPHGPGARPSTVRGEGASGRSPYEILLASIDEFKRKEKVDIDTERVAIVLWSGVHGLASLLLDKAWRPASDAEARRALTDFVETTLAGLRRA